MLIPRVIISMYWYCYALVFNFFITFTFTITLIRRKLRLKAPNLLIQIHLLRISITDIISMIIHCWLFPSHTLGNWNAALVICITILVNIRSNISDTLILRNSIIFSLFGIRDSFPLDQSL